MKEINNPYLTIINGKTKFNPADFKGFEYDEVEVRLGDWGKKTARIEKQTHLAYQKAVEDFEKIGAKCTLNSAGRSKFDQLYTKIEKLGGIIKRSKSVIKAVKGTQATTAKIGYSEHLSALAIDMSVNMRTAKIPEKIIERYPDASKTELEFLTKRIIMEKHGFILTYPSDIRLYKVTGISNTEDWHWRYVGPEHSQMIGKIREKVYADLGTNYEVFLEDYIELLSDEGIKASNNKDLVDMYASVFESEILEIDVSENVEVGLFDKF